jgi:hypothetical protein
MPDLVSFFTIDWSTAIAIAKPITFEHGRAFYLNPIAIAQGDVDAPVKIAIVKSPDGVAAAQNATATDEMDTFKRLAPDGAGGTRWALPLEGSTTGLGANDNEITDTLLNAGLWFVQYQAYAVSGVAVIATKTGTAFLLNGAILTQSSMVTSTNSGTVAQSVASTGFSVSGSGASKKITCTRIPTAGTTDERMIAARMA